MNVDGNTFAGLQRYEFSLQADSSLVIRSFDTGQELVIAEADLAGFQSCLAETIAVLAPAQPDKPKERIGEKWTAEEEEFVLDEYASGRTIAEIARSVLRKPGGIRRRLKRLEIMDAPDSRAAAQALLAEREEAVTATPPAPTKRVVEHDPELDHGIDFASL